MGDTEYIKDDLTLEQIDALNNYDRYYGIDFISYNGKYPNLCDGELVIKIRNTVISFDSILMSGGSIFGPDGDYEVSTDKWEVCEYRFKDIFDNDKTKYDFFRDLLEIVNNKVEYGCCGGCV